MLVSLAPTPSEPFFSFFFFLSRFESLCFVFVWIAGIVRSTVSRGDGSRFTGLDSAEEMYMTSLSWSSSGSTLTFGSFFCFCCWARGPFPP